MNSESTNNNRSSGMYVVFRAIAVFLIKVLFFAKVIGKENIPEGAAILCANHSNTADPVYVVLAVSGRDQIHFMAKMELFRKKFGAWFFGSLGAFPVNRQESDVSAIRTSLKYLKSGAKLGIFPEGTRVSEDDAIQAKNGAIRIAEKTGVPVVPINVPRKKKLFRKNTVVIGKPYYINPERKKLTGEEYTEYSEQLMEKIKELQAE